MLGRGGRRNQGGGGGGGGTYLEVLNNLSDLNNAGTARANLGFTTHTAGRVLLGDGSTTSTDDALLFFDTASKSLSVNLATAGTGATLDVGGVTGGIGFPVATSVEQAAITPARNGVMLYNSNTHTFSGFLNGAWVNLGDHGTLAGLADDDHTQYALLAGRATGQVLKGGTAASETLTLQSTNHATRGKILFGSAGLDVYDEVNARFGIGIAVPTAKLHMKAGSANETLISLVNSAGGVPVDFRYETGSIFRIDQGAGSMLVYGNGCLNLMGTQLGVYKVQVQGPSTQTNAVTALTRNTGDMVFAVMNSSATANNVSGLVFACSSTTNQTTSGIAGVHEVHTSGSETGHLGFYTANTGTLARRMKIAKDGVITMDAYTAGLSLFSGAGVISSLAAGAAGRVLYSDGTTWAASTRKEKAGKVDLTSGTTSKAITFATARADALYTPIWSFINTVDGDPVSIPHRIIAIATTGFTVEWDEELLTGDYDGYWGILEHYDP